MRLLNLPDELIDGVVTALDPVKDRRSLYNLCLTSRTLCDISQPSLFSTYADVGKRPQRHNKEGEIEIGPALRIPFFMFVRTLVLRPDLALKVKTVNVDDIYHDSTWNRGIHDPTESFMTEDLRILCGALNRLEVDQEAIWDWEYRLVRFNMHAVLAIFICLAPNLQHLSCFLDSHFYGHIRVLNDLAYNRGEPHSYTRTALQSLTIRSGDDDSQFDLDEIAPIISLPTLKTLDAARCYGNNFFQFDPPASSLNLTAISLNQTRMDTKSVMALLAACRTLKKFNYEFYRTNESKPVCRPAELILALQPQAPTLEELRLRGFDKPTNHWMDPLRAFQRLKKIDMDAMMLWNEPLLSVLPLSLEHLLLLGQYAIESTLEALDLSNHHEELPRLKKITVNTADFADLVDDDVGMYSEEDTLKMYYAWKVLYLDNTGIELVFINSRFPNFDDTYEPPVTPQFIRAEMERIREKKARGGGIVSVIYNTGNSQLWSPTPGL